MTFALMIIGIVFWVIFEMYVYSEPSRDVFGWSFIWTNEWEPVQLEFGALAFIYGTTISSIIALVLALPVSLGVAVFLSEIAHKYIKTTISFIIEILAAIPSIIYGFWGIFVLVPIMRTDIQPR